MRSVMICRLPWGMRRHLAVVISGCGLLLGSLPAHAYQFDWDVFGGITGTLNTEFQLGAQWRMEERQSHLVGKANINPLICDSGCQGHTIENDTSLPLFNLPDEGNTANAQRIDTPGAFSSNTDDGNLQFNKGDVTQAIGQIKQDLTLQFGDWTFFTRYYYYYDFENVDRQLVHPNLVTRASAAEARARVERAKAGMDDFGFPTVGDPVTIDEELVDFSFSSREEQQGQDFRLLDFNIQGFLPVPFTEDREFQITVGRQTINWGESTVLVVNSLNTINPPDVNALFRPAFLALDEVFEPVGAIKLSTSLTPNTSAEIFYQYEWEGVQIPPRGAFLSFVDVNLEENNRQPLHLGFGSVAEDIFPHALAEELGEPTPGDSSFGIQRAEQVLLSAISDTTVSVDLLPANEPEDGGQYGAAFTWFLPDFNNGTELRFYFANYHSRLPYLSFFAGAQSCAFFVRPTGRAFGNGGTDGIQAIENTSAACPDLDFERFTAALAQNNALGADPDVVQGALNQLIVASVGAGGNNSASGITGNGFRLNSVSAQLEYPEDIRMYGISFNTSFGDISVQGEVAYRPNLPLQVDDLDLAFAAANPTAPQGCDPINSANIQPGDCAGGLGSDDDGLGFGFGPASREFAYLPGHNATFPDFVGPFRGLDTILPGQYIQGFEPFKVLQYNVGATYVLGPTSFAADIIKASQIILLFEAGATQVLDFPDICELQIEGPGSFTHFSPGADGTGTPSGGGTVCDRPDLGNVRDGINGTRFNPTQAAEESFADAFSWGYRIVGLIRYDNVLPGISFEPVFIIAHDVDGTAPGPGENFIEGRQNYVLNVEMRYQQNWSASLGYVWFRGAEPFNLLGDRDFLQAGIRYRF